MQSNIKTLNNYELLQLKEFCDFKISEDGYLYQKDVKKIPTSGIIKYLVKKEDAIGQISKDKIIIYKGELYRRVTIPLFRGGIQEKFVIRAIRVLTNKYILNGTSTLLKTLELLCIDGDDRIYWSCLSHENNYPIIYDRAKIIDDILEGVNKNDNKG